MRIAWKLTTALTVGAALFFGAHEWERERRERAALVADVDRDHRDLGAAIVASWNGESHDELRAAVGRVSASRKELTVALVAPTMARRTSDQHTRISYIDVRRGTATSTAMIEIAERIEWHGSVIGALRREAIGALAALIVFFFVMTAVLSERLIAKPTRALIARTRRIGEGDLAPGFHTHRGDELGDLSRAIDAMRGKLAEAREEVLRESVARSSAVEQLRHADRLGTVGKLAAGIAHELGTPLNVITGRATFLARATDVADVQRQAGAIAEAAERLSRLVKQLLSFARRSEPCLRAQPVWPVVERATVFVEPLARKRGVTLEGHCDDKTAFADIDATQIEQVLTNLLMNAIQASPPMARVEVRGLIRDGAVVIEVCDSGAGIAEADLPRVFDPFFTTKDVGEGTGLGLSVARGIAAEHGGTVTLESRRGAGTTATLRLPLKRAR